MERLRAQPASTAVLLVDDDGHFLSAMSRAFMRLGWRVATASRSDEAIAAARLHRPTVVILDLMLGDESGIDLIEPLLAQLPAARIILTTGHPSLQTAIEAMRRGAQDYVSKPCSASELVAAASVARGPSGDVVSILRSERALIERVLAACHGNVSEAARRLGMHRRSLQRRLRPRLRPR